MASDRPRDFAEGAPRRPGPALDAFSEENQTLVAGLRSQDPDLRRQALELVVESVDDEIAGELLRIVESDPDHDFRARAAIALGPAIESCGLELDEDGQLPDPEDPLSLSDLSQEGYEGLQARLRRIYEDPSAPVEVRRRALESSVRAPRSWHDLAIRNAWASDDDGWRMTALFCMGFASSDFDAEIADGLDSGSQDLTLEAIVAAGRRSVDRLAPRIAEIAADGARDRVLRLAAIEALASLEGADRALAELTEDYDPEIAGAASESSLERETTKRLSEIDDLADVVSLDDPGVRERLD